MKRQYVIDGRDPNAKGYVYENRMANRQETAAIVKALGTFKVADADRCNYWLYGRLDDVYGWYLFGMKESGEGDAEERFVILDDCLDPLEWPYNKVLDTDDVMEFARTTGSGENVGTALYAVQEWGLGGGFADGEYVWVLTIYKDGEFFPEVHRTFEGAVGGVVMDINAGVAFDEDEYDFDKIREELEEQLYWKDDFTNTTYDIAECKVFK